MSSQNPNPFVKELATIHEALGRLGYRLQEIVIRPNPATSEMRRHSLTLEDNTARHDSLEAARPASSAGPPTILDGRWAQGRDVPILLIDTHISTPMDVEYEVIQETNQGSQSHNTMASAHPHDNGHERKRPRSDDDELAEAGTDYQPGTKRAKPSNS